MRSMLAASIEKSSSRRSDSERYEKTAGRSMMRSNARRLPTLSANSWSSARSSRIWCSARGRCTLSTTSEPSGQARTVHLRDRAGGERLGLDVRERVLPRHAQLALDHAPRPRPGSAAACRPAAARAPRCTRAGADRGASRAPGRAWRTSARAPRAPRAGGARGRRVDAPRASRGGRRRGRSRAARPSSRSRGTSRGNGREPSATKTTLQRAA